MNKEDPEDKPKSDLKKFGISIHSHSVKGIITEEDLQRQKRRDIGKKIDLKLDDNGEFNNG